MEDEVQGLLRAARYDEAFERLLERHETQVFRMAVMMLHDPGRAEEVTQDVFLTGEVVMLFYLQDRSLHDIALMLNLPQGTVKSHLHRARRALAQMMAGRTSTP